MPSSDLMEKIVSLCRKRGFIFQSSEIYGGINGFWDYGPLGVELKKNIKDAWWRDMVRNPPLGPNGQEITMVGLDCSIIMNRKVWVASGHASGFQDPMCDCKETKKRYRADQLEVFSGHPEVNPPLMYAFIKGDEESLKLAIKKAEKAARAAGKKFTQPVHSVSYMTLAKNADARNQVVGPDVEVPGTLTEARPFNLMFETHAGAIKDDDNLVYLRPETAQGIFANFKNVVDSSRVKIPFGIAQIGKAFRNEVNPRNYTFRSREFEQMEIEFFCHPSESRMWYEYWRDVRKNWYSTLGIRSEKLKPREQTPEELAHYSVGTTDIEYLFPFSDEHQELEGVAHRGDFDLKAHMEHSKQSLLYFDEDAWNRDAAGRSTNSFVAWLKGNPSPEEVAKYQFIPHVIEPSAGADRFTLAVLCEAYTEDKAPNADGKLEERLVMKFHPRLAPVKAAIFPLVKKDGMPEKAYALYRELKAHFNVQYDDGGAVGRRYRRQDEIGTPFCITIDGETMQNDTVTIRDRDTLVQRRIPISSVLHELRTLIG
ncbi:MAG: glycine--tRNA ligase [Gemmataceae bacterium]|jgi:glycyl-tRNA synthetase|nr:glycine--tRNA ligase [Gemmataceae bacterium]